MEKEKKPVSVESLVTDGDPRFFLESAQPFQRLMMQYRCALHEVRSKFEVLDMEMSLHRDGNPIESISCRLKKPASILEKLERKGLPFSISNIEENIFDVAGIRVVCSFTDDIYQISERMLLQNDMRLLRVKDYIKNPKQNGYRSLHLVVSVPVMFAEGTKHMPVEIQFRTIAMDFWASIEHKLRYKKDLPEPLSASIAEDLKSCAGIINMTDMRMQEINRRIEALGRKIV